MKMWGKVHLFVVKEVIGPFYRTNNWFLLRLGNFLRNLFVFIFKCDISPSADIPYSTRFPHYIGVVIAACKIGENCFIRQNTTIGGKYTITPEEAKKRALSGKEERQAAHPNIESFVDIGANVCILGPITIGSHSVIGAGSVVVKDVEPYSIYAGVPAKKIRDLSKPGPESDPHPYYNPEGNKNNFF